MLASPSLRCIEGPLTLVGNLLSQCCTSLDLYRQKSSLPQTQEDVLPRLSEKALREGESALKLSCLMPISTDKWRR
jgi:hypothetical protein